MSVGGMTSAAQEAGLAGTAGLAEGLGRDRIATRPPTWIVAGLVLLGVAGMAGGIAGPYISGWYDGPIDPWEHPIYELENGLFYFLGLLAWVRRPDNRTGVLMMAVPVAGWLSLLSWIDSDALFVLGIFHIDNLDLIVLAHLFLAFPTGRLEARVERRTIQILYGSWATLNTAQTLTLDARWWDRFSNPFLVWSNESLHNALVHAGSVMGACAGAWILFLGVRRWVRASPARRRVLAPVALGTIPTGIWVIFNFAVARQLHLWNVDLTTTLVDNYVATLAMVALPTGFAMGLWRTRVGRGRVGELVIELGEGGSEVGRVQETLREVFRDPTLQVAYRLPGRGWVDESGGSFVVPQPNDDTVAVTPVEAHDDTIAVLVHDPGVLEDPDLLAGGVAATRLAVDNERLQASLRAQLEQVRASRARIVEAGDVERRRIERNLHDGAQQRLATLALHLGRIRSRVGDDADDGLVAAVAAATKDLQGASAELRDLARGIHPPILTEEGLHAAVEVLVERAGVPVEVVGLPEPRLPERVEATGYYVVAEALTNTVRYAHAGLVRIGVTMDGSVVEVSVVDDGVGGADVSAGTGLAGLADRVGALGGTLVVDSPVGVGTTVVARIPIHDG